MNRKILKRILAFLLSVVMMLGIVPDMGIVAQASEDKVYISVSKDANYIQDKNGGYIANVGIPLDDVAKVDLEDYDLSGYKYDRDNDGNYEITALQLIIYAHEKLYGGSWDDVTLTGNPGSTYFAGGIFGFSENLNYFHNGTFPIDEEMSESAGYSVGATSDRIVLSAGDYIDIGSFTNWDFYSDSNYGFHKFADAEDNFTHSYDTEAGKETMVKLVRSYSAMGGGAQVIDEAGYTVSYGTAYGTATGTATTDNNGTVNITFPSAGTWYVWCDGGYGNEYPDSIVSTPAMATVVVSESTQPPVIEVESIELDKTTEELEIGSTTTLTATVAPENATDKTVTWTSSGDSIATVENGVVTAIDAGTATITATITATAGDKTASCTVTVKEAATETNLKLDVNHTSSNGSLKSITFSDENGNEIQGLAAAINDKTITVSLPKDFAANGKVKAAFELTQNGDVPFVTTKTSASGTTSGKAVNNKFTEKTVALSNGAATFTFYYYDIVPSAVKNVYETFTIEYKVKNELPVLTESYSSGTGTAEKYFEDHYTLDLSKVFTDADGDSLSYQVKIDDGNWTNIEGNSYTFVPEIAGTYTIAFRAYDTKDYSEETYTVTLTVKNSAETYDVTVDVPEGITPTFYSSNEAGAKGTEISAAANGMAYTVKVPQNVSYIRWEADGMAMHTAVESGKTYTLLKTRFVAMTGETEDTGATVSVKYESYSATGSSNSYLLLEGINYTVTATPSNSAYRTTTLTEQNAVSGNKEIKLELKHFTVTAPEGSVVSAGTMSNYFVYSFKEPISTENVNETVVYKFAPISGTSFIRVQNSDSDAVTYWDYSTTLSDGAEFTITEEMLFMNDQSNEGEFNSDTIYHNFEYYGHDVADVYINANEKGYINLEKDGTKTLNIHRDWHAIEGISNAKTALPDVNYTVIDFNGNASDVVTVTPDKNNSSVATITAVKEGTAIVLVTYDAMYSTQTISGATVGNGGANRFSAIWPENTGVLVVSVGADGSGIATNMTINEGKNANPATSKTVLDKIDAEHDVLYYVGTDGASYTFTPEDGCTVSIAKAALTKNSLTYNGFESVAANEDGSFTLAGLTSGSHIVKIEKDGVAAYQVICAKQTSVSVVDGKGDVVSEQNRVKPGETVTIVLGDIYNPINKLSGIYNTNCKVSYTGEDNKNFSGNPGSTFGYYIFASDKNLHKLNVTIPENWDKETYTLEGCLNTAGFGSSAGVHRNALLYSTGKPVNMTAEATSAFLCSLPEVVISVNTDHAENVSLDKETLALKIGEKYTLKETTSPVDTIDEASWTSSKEEIAFVDQNGIVIAVKPGTAEITVSVNGKTAVCEVTVTDEVFVDTTDGVTIETGASTTPEKRQSTITKIVVDGVNLEGIANKESDKVYKIELDENTYSALDITLTPAVGDQSSNNYTPYYYLNGTNTNLIATDKTPSTITVDGDWNNNGEMEVVVGIGSQKNGIMDSYTLKIKILVKATGISIPETLVLDSNVEGASASLTATLTPSNSNETITWSSFNPEVAAVDKNGVVTAVSKGTVTITATVGDKSASCLVTVKRIAKLESLIIHSDSKPAFDGTNTNVFLENEGDNYSSGKVFRKDTLTYTLETGYNDSSNQLSFRAAPENVDDTVTLYYGDGKSKDIKWNSGMDSIWVSNLLKGGKNTFTIVVSGENAESTTYTFNADVKPTMTAEITADSIVYMEKPFTSSESDCTAIVSDNTKQLTFTAKPRSESYTVTYNDSASNVVNIENTDKVEVQVSADGVINTYTVNLIKKPVYTVEFNVSPSDAQITVFDHKGNVIAPNADGSYTGMLADFTYTYSAVKNGYVSQQGEILENGGKIDITLEKVLGKQPTEVDSYWPTFRGSGNNMAITDARTPQSEDAENISVKWVKMMGEKSQWGFLIARPSVQIIVDDTLVVMSNKVIYKLDLETGEILAQADMVAAPNWGYTPPTYAAGMIFAPLTNGTIQAFNAKTLESLWVYKDSLGGQALSPITYSDGHIYTGFWNGEENDANYVCIPVTDEDTTKSDETKLAAWKHTQKGGFYWTGSVAVGDAVIVGTDDGTSGTKGNSQLYSFAKETGEIISCVELTGMGDQRSSMAYDAESGRVYFTTKGGYLCSAKVNAQTGVVSELKGVDNKAQTTSTPVVYKDRVYYATGSGISTTGSSGNVVVADADTLEMLFAVGLKGYPQCSLLLSTAYEQQTGCVYLYSTYNNRPGGISVIKVKTDCKTTEDAALTELYDAKGYEEFCITSIICGEDGTLYYKNDSGNVFAIGIPSAANVEKLINDIGEVTIEDEGIISAAREAYDALSEEDKKLVSNYEKLVAAEKELAKLQKEALDQAAADTVIKLINAIGKININSYKKIDAARAAYDKLNADQKKLVTNYETLIKAEKDYDEIVDEAVDEVEDLIDDIGEVTLESASAIAKARKAYNFLPAHVQKLVKNLDVLEDAEEELAKLRKETLELIKTGKTVLTKSELLQMQDKFEAVTEKTTYNEALNLLLTYYRLGEKQQLALADSEKLTLLQNIVGKTNHEDPSTGVSVTGLEWNIRVVVNPVKNDELKDQLMSQLEHAEMLSMLDIYLEDVLTGKKHQLDGTVEVSIPVELIGDYTMYDRLGILHYTEDDQIEILNCKVIDGYVVFKAVEFSYYAVIGFMDAEVISEETVIQTEQPEETIENEKAEITQDAVETVSDNNNWLVWAAAGGLGIILLAVLLVLKKRMTEEN